MRLNIIGSNSAGNCYILENDQEALIIECGLRFDKIQQGLAFNLRKVVGCLISHEHLDHAFAAVDIASKGINLYASAGTFKAIKGNIPQHKKIEVTSGAVIEIGNFMVIPFDVRHDAAQPLGFLIHHAETGNILFLTDTYYAPYRFPGLHNIIVEANYSQEIIDRRLREGANPEFLRNRVLQSHMSLATCQGLLKANDLSAVNNIVLIHLSDSNSNAKQFGDLVREQTGKTVCVAEAGMIIEDFNKEPF